jgi:uncharacterized protein YecE (DUF72 family)
MARLHVGLTSLSGDIKNYKERFDLVELHPVDTSLPKPAALRKWRKAVPPAFVFSVVLPRVVSELVPGPELDAALAASLEVATAVEARCVLLSTPPEVRPTSQNRKRIAALFERIPADGVVRCWEARGMWERDEVVATARAASVLPVFDATRDEPAPGPLVYTRMRSLGAATLPSAAAVARMAGRLQGRREVFVAVEGHRSAGLRVKDGLRAALARQKDQPETGSVMRTQVFVPPLEAEDEEQ